MSAIKSLRQAIADHDLVLLDGAMGTELYQRGVFINQCFENTNLDNPKIVEGVHKDYLDAGARALTTNTWGANRLKLRTFGIENSIAAINTRGVELAKALAKGRAWVLGSIGSLGIALEPLGPTSREEARTIFAEQAKFLVDAGADGLAFESFTNLEELIQAVLAAREVDAHIPIFAYVAINEDGCLLNGAALEEVAAALNDLPADVIGFNCSVGPQPMLAQAERLLRLSAKPVAVKPNAGVPKIVDGRYLYMSTPAYFAHFAKDISETGVQFVGGCCGSSPAHIKAMAQAMRYGQSVRRSTRSGVPATVKERAKTTSTQHEAPVSAWAQRLEQGKKVISVELVPASGGCVAETLEKARQLKEAGVHAINVPDLPRATARASALLTAILIERQVGIETVLHLTCRDRNVLGMQSDLLGAHAIGLRNMLLVTGDPPKMGTYPEATGVFDVDAIGLTNIVTGLNNGADISGAPLREPTRFSIGVGVNPGHRDFAYEMKRFAWKVDAGAQWAITQPVFDIDCFWRFCDYITKHDLKIPIIAGVWPLTSYRNALFMHNEVPGIDIPTDIIAAMEQSKEPLKTGVDIAQKMVNKIAANVQGFQVSAPFGRVDLALQVCEAPLAQTLCC